MVLTSSIYSYCLKLSALVDGNWDFHPKFDEIMRRGKMERSQKLVNLERAREWEIAKRKKKESLVKMLALIKCVKNACVN